MTSFGILKRMLNMINTSDKRMLNMNDTIDKFPYIKLQYDALREEILSAKDRSVKIILGGTISIPATELIGAAYDVPLIIFIAPLLVITLMLIYLSENNCIMRAGKFLREEVEPLFPGVPGWENWLEDKKSTKYDRRKGDKFVNYSFFVLWVFYYALAVYLAAFQSSQMYGLIGLFIAISLYSSLGIFLYIYMMRSAMKSTRTD